MLLVCALALPLIAGRRAAAQSLPDTTLPASTSQPSTNPTGFAPEAAPENSSDNEPDSDNGTSSDDAAPQTPLSADQIIAILQQNPDLLADLKSEVAGQMQQQGMTVDPASISDQALYREISSNADLRASISQVLRARGYGTSELSPPSPSATRESDLNLSSSQGGMESETGPWSGMNRAANATSLAGADEALAAHRSGEMQRESSRRREPANASTDLPRVVQEPAPYDLQALHDLYQQFPDETSPLHRFGAEVFVNRATSAMGRGSTARDTPLDVPLGPDYVVGPGDQLTIELWGGVTQSITRAVGRDGSIFLPEAGALQVAGLPLGTVQNLIGGALQRQYRDAQVAVTVSRLRSVRIYVVGDIQRPGGYDVSSLATPVSLLYAAGGPTAAGSLRTALHERGDRLIEKIDLYDFLLHGVRKGSAPFQSGDTLVVPPAGPLVAVTGAVRRPAIYELNDTEASLASVIEDAGGFTAAASLSHIRIERIDPHRQRETVTLDRSGRSASETQPPAVAALRVQDGDRIRVEPILPYSQRAIYLAGHVVRPGRLPYTQDMHVSDVLRSYRDVLPEPADRAEIVRLVPPDLHAETIEFSLPDVLAGHAQISLLPFDTIRVFGRYQLDAPMVTIRGQVLRPGTYPMSRGMTAAQLVRMAGGFRRDALRARADLTSYQVDNGNRIAELLSTVRIGDAVEGSDPQADVPLKPGDILSIHQITSWDDIGESVTIQGQVRYPGSYGFTDGEKLSSVLRRAGGLLPTAYPAGAVLVRVQVKQEEENSREELIRQIETNSAAARLSPTAAAGGNAAGALQLIKAQEDQVLSNLKAHPPGGRMVIHMTADIDSWANSPADIELRRGDVLTIPKRPGFVLVTGQVYNATALSFAPGRTAEWYLGRAGGTNSTANRKEIFIIRANGSVVGRHSGGWLGGSVLATRLQPGDIVVVPQKILGGSLFWRNLLSTGQLAASVAITAGVAAAAL
ncbi:MAG TPA: SLBB domain-containing protein [Acidobacteriaceae bacterium]|nr:SLBB domain-containing protein [Acidobacteriaceae bacterium]